MELADYNLEGVDGVLGDPRRLEIGSNVVEDGGDVESGGVKVHQDSEGLYFEGRRDILEFEYILHHLRDDRGWLGLSNNTLEDKET